MRLGQLTRKLDIETATAVKFLAKNGIELEDHPNTKLDENAMELLEAEFTKTTEPKIDESTNASVGKSFSIDPNEVELPIPESTPQSALIWQDPINEDPEEGINSTTTPLKEAYQSIKEEILGVSKVISEEPIDIGQEMEVSPNQAGNSAEKLEAEIEKIITLPKEEVDKLVETGEIQSDIEAEAATLDEFGVIKAKTKKLEGLSVKGKIELPHDPRREKKELARKAQEEVQKIQSNAGKTIDGVHPTKRAKEEGERIKEALAKEEEIAIAKAEKLRLRVERQAAKENAQENKSSKRKSKHKKLVQEKTLSPEELKKKKAREKRQKEKEKANAPAPTRSLLQKIWDFIK